MVTAINTKKLRNFTQKQGNHVKMTRVTPFGTFDWWWFSSMFAGEVHGRLADFENVFFAASGATDQKLHDDICDSAAAKPFGRMLKEASDALADLPT